MVWYEEGLWPTCICDWSESLQRRRGMGSGFVGANMGLGFGWWRRVWPWRMLHRGVCYREGSRDREKQKSFIRRVYILIDEEYIYLIKRKKIRFKKKNDDVENCGVSKVFGFIYIYINKGILHFTHLWFKKWHFAYLSSNLLTKRLPTSVLPLL